MKEPDSWKLRFAAKEAGFKAVFPSFGRFLDFKEARTVINGKTLSIEILPKNWQGPRILSGVWARKEGHWMVLVSIPAA
jgi:4'-phosphopantetheinyl transferase EntD